MSNHFTLETRGYCILCLQLPKPQTVDLEDDEDEIFIINYNDKKEEEKILPSKTISLRKMCRYLKMNLGQVFSKSMPVNPTSLALLEQSELKGTVCTNCEGLIKDFSEVGDKIEELEAKLKFYLGKIQDKVQMAEGSKEVFKNEMVKQPNTTLHCGIVEELRKETLNCVNSVVLRQQPLLIAREIPPQPHQRTSSTLYKCDMCPLAFFDLRGLNEHKTRNHPGLMHKCGHCPREFLLKTTLTSHINRCHSDLVRKDPESQPESTNHNVNTTQGNSNHQPPKPPSASAASDSFLDDLLNPTQSIISSMYPENRKRPELSAKKKVEPGEVQAPLNYECPLCKDRFPSSEHVKFHLRDVHFGWKCEFCTKTFSERHLKFKHQRMFHGQQSKKVMFGKRKRPSILSRSSKIRKVNPNPKPEEEIQNCDKTEKEVTSEVKEKGEEEIEEMEEVPGRTEIVELDLE